MSVNVAIKETVQNINVPEENVEIQVPEKIISVTNPGSQGPPGPPGASGSGSFHDQSVTPSNGQTAFTLDFLPVNNNSVFMFVNGQIFFPGKGFIISGVSITWSESFALSNTDSVVFRYKKS